MRASAAAGRPQRQPVTSGMSSPCSRMYCLCSISLSRIACLSVRGPRPELRHAIDHVLHQVEAVEIVQHDHVEGRRGGALFLVPANVQVAVVRAAVGEPVDQPGIAVEGEDDRLVRGEERVEVVGRSARADARSCGCSFIRSTTLTTRTLSSGK